MRAKQRDLRRIMFCSVDEFRVDMLVLYDAGATDNASETAGLPHQPLNRIWDIVSETVSVINCVPLPYRSNFHCLADGGLERLRAMVSIGALGHVRSHRFIGQPLDNGPCKALVLSAKILILLARPTGIEPVFPP